MCVEPLKGYHVCEGLHGSIYSSGLPSEVSVGLLGRTLYLYDHGITLVSMLRSLVWHRAYSFPLRGGAIEHCPQWIERPEDDKINTK